MDQKSVATGGPVSGVIAPLAPAGNDDFARSYNAAMDAAVPHVRDAKLNLFEANKLNPDEAAKAANVANKTGLPPDTVERNLSMIEEDVKAAAQSQAMAQNPYLAQFYADRKNAVVAHDDYEKLDVLSKIWEAGSRGVADTFRSNAAARAALPFLGREMSPAVAAQAREAQALAAAPFGGDDNSFYKFVKGASGFLGGLVEQSVQALPTAVAGAITGTAIGTAGGPAAVITAPVGALLGATTGFVAGMVSDGYKVGAGQIYLMLKDQEDGQGNKIDPETVRWAAHGGGVVLGLLNMIGAKGVEKAVGPAAGSIAALFTQDVIARPTLTRAMADFGKGTLKGVGVGAGFGAANEATMIAAETIAKEVSSGDWQTVLNSPEERKKAADRLAHSMIEMAAAFGTMHAVGGSVKLGADVARVRQGERDAAWVDRVNTAIGETKTLGRDRDAIKRFLETQADGTPVENVFVPAGKVRELFQKYGLDPDAPGFVDPVFGFVRDMPEQLREARETGGDVVIPAKDYFARLAGTEVFDQLKQDIRVRQDGMSFREARDAEHQRMAKLDNEAADWMRRVEAGDDMIAPGVRVQDDMFGKLRAAGYTNDVAAKYAAVYAARYTTRAERTGQGDAWTQYQRSGIDVQQVLPESVRFAAPDHLDVLLNSIRSGKDPVAAKGAPSLLEFIGRRGGMVDAGGELKARGLHTWHLGEKGRPIRGRTSLIADASGEGQAAMFGKAAGGKKLSLHDTAHAAWEEGYFAEHAEPPTQDHLLAAIDEELRGRPRVSENAPHDPREGFRKDRAELDEVLNRLGIDVKKLRNKDIREALAKIEDGADGYEQRANKDPRIVSSKEMQEKVLQEEWRRNGPDLDYDDLPPGVWEREVKAWNKEHGTSIDPDYYELNPKADFDRHIEAKYLAGKKPPFPGVKKANEYFEGRSYVSDDEPLYGAYLKGEGPTYDQTKRGSIKFSDGRALISLFQARDLSTFLHETGHLWLEEMRADAMAPGASDAVKADFAAVQKLVGHNGGKFEVAHHEAFARAAEAYFMEGKAPSEGLVAAFRSFKQWLISIYKSVDSLNSPISADLRGVFDRLIATDAEIAEAKQRQGFNPLFKSRAEAGMTKAEFAAYTSAINAAADRAEAGALAKVMADVRRKRTAEWKAEEKATSETVTADTMREPGQSALHLLRTGKLWEGETPELLRGVKLSRDEIVALYGDEAALKMLPFGIYAKDAPAVEGKPAPRTMPADNLAEVLGFTSGKAMIDRLMGLEAQRASLREKGDKRSVARAIIEEEVDRRMTERHGDALTDGSIEAEAMAAIHNDRQAAVMSTEMKALARQAGDAAPVTWKDIKAWAADAIAGKRVKDATAAERFAKAERDAGAEVQRALLKGDKIAAFKAKQNQLVNHALYIESKKAADDVASAVKLMDRYASAKTLKAMAQDYLEQIHGLLERFDFKRASERELNRRADFAEWAIQQQADGVDVVAPEKFMNASFRTHYSDMTVEELRGLADTVKQVAYLGRMKKDLILNGVKREFDAFKAEAISVVEGLRQRELADERDPHEAGDGFREKVRAKLERVKGGARGFQATMLKMEEMFGVLDAGNSNGAFNSVFRSLSHAQNHENALLTQVTKKLLQLGRALPKETAREWQTRHEIPELIDSKTGKASSLLKSKVIAIALNTGNESNHDKMLRGEKWDREAVKTVLDRMLTAKDWEYVQGVWDTIGELWPQIEAMEKAVNGVAPPKVEPTIVDTPHGSFRGGYYPAVYDPLRSGDVAERLGSSADALFEKNFVRATTSRDFVNARAESFARPFLLSLDVIPRHVSEVIHDIAFREAVMQADKFLSDKDVRKAVDDAVGPEWSAQFRPWLKNIANEWANDRRGLTFWDNVFKGARTNATIVAMGYRITTMMAQVTGVLDSAEMIGGKWMLKGLGEFAGDPLHMSATRDFVFEKSGEMRNRMNTTERDVRDQVRQLAGKRGLGAEVQRFAFYGIAMMDMGVSLPTWMGAYKKALHEGMSDADAVYSADKVVRLSQGASGPKDMAAVTRGTEGQKLFTMFYSYFSHQYNRASSIVRDARNVQSGGDVAMIAARSFFLMIGPTIIGQLLSGQGPKEEENPLTWAARKVALSPFNMVPGVRDVVNTADQWMGGSFASYTATPAARFADTLLHAGLDLTHALGGGSGEVSDKWVKHAMESAGYIFGLPTGQAANTTQFLWDVSDGNQAPADLVDWLKGLIYGKFEDKK